MDLIETFILLLMEKLGMRLRGVSKGRVYGAPRMPKSKVSASSSQHSYSVHSTYPSTVIQELKDELQLKDALLSSMQR